MAEKPTTAIATTTTATTLPLPPPPPQHQSLTYQDLTTHISDLEQQLADLVRTNATLVEQVDKHYSRLNTLELRGLPHKISTTISEEVKRSVQDAMQAPLREQFRELPEADMKHILEHRIWEIRSYETHQDHMNLYEALQKSIEHPPLPPPKDSDKSKKRRHDSGASRSTLPPSPPLADSDRSKKKKHSSGASDALASTYQASAKNSLLEQTGDMAVFMDWYCNRQGKTKLTQADFEGQAYEFVKPFYPNAIHLRFQMEECHKLLTDQVDWANLEGDQVRFDVSKPLPLGGPPGHVTIQTQFFFNKDLDYLRYGSKERRPA
ncbi:hypothetical protein Tco_1201348 [Tanacetum coccineum]